jgi:hypothetical protein
VPQLLVPAVAGAVCCGVAALAGAWVLSLFRGSLVTPPWPWDPFVFEVTPLLLPCWFLLGLAVGTLAGVACRRTVPAMAAALAATAGIAFLGFRNGLLLNVLLPLGTRTAPGSAFLGPVCQVQAEGSRTRVLEPCTFADPAANPYGHGIIVHGFFTHAGHALTVAQSAALGTRVPLALFAANSPTDAPVRHWLAARDYTYWISYQPISHYGLMQGLAAALLIVLAVALAGTAIWLLRRRPA